MAIYLFDPSSFQQLYNCSLYSVDDVPLEQRRHPILGTISIAFFLVAEILYIPCIFAISRYLKESCYKILFCISLLDFFALFFIGLLTGIFGIQGTVFCSAPRFMYSAGMVGNFFYGFETLASILLAANRCLETINSKIADRLFSGQKTWFWIVSVWLYSLYFAIFDKAVVFNSITYTWVFNPHMSYIGGIDDLYKSYVDIVHEALMAILIPFFYCLFFIFLNKKQKIATNNNQQPINGLGGKANQRKIIFMQVFLLSLLNVTISICYLLMGFIEVNAMVTIICTTYGWLLIHGLPPFIYLGLNRTLRKECLKIIRKLIKIGPLNNKKQENAVANVHSRHTQFISRNSAIGGKSQINNGIIMQYRERPPLDREVEFFDPVSSIELAPQPTIELLDITSDDGAGSGFDFLRLYSLCPIDDETPKKQQQKPTKTIHQLAISHSINNEQPELKMKIHPTSIKKSTTNPSTGPIYYTPKFVSNKRQEKNPDGRFFAIDFGSTNSLIAISSPTGVQVLINPDSLNNSTLIASCVSYNNETNEIHIGSASNLQNSRDWDAIYDVKRLMGKNMNDIGIKETLNFWAKMVQLPLRPDFDGQPFIEVQHIGIPFCLRLMDVTAQLLSKLLTIAEQSANLYGTDFIERALITIPTSFSTCQKNVVLEASKLTGLREVRFITDAEADCLVAHAYNSHQYKHDGHTILVYDFGSGKFDAKILRAQNEIFHLVKTRGTDFGGREIDAILMDYVAEKIKRQYGHDLIANTNDKRQLLQSCVKLKENLSVAVYDSLHFDNYGILTRVEFECLIEQLITKTIDAIGNILKKDQIHKILLIGGSSKIPLIRSKLIDYGFPQAIIMQSNDPHQTIVKGVAAFMSSFDSEFSSIQNMSERVAQKRLDSVKEKLVEFLHDVDE